MKIIKHPKQFKRICMVSSALFSAASGVYGWLAPFGAALGLGIDLTDDIQQSQSNIEAFNKAVDAALDRTKHHISSDSKQKILDELCTIEVEPDSLSELIKKTEAYQKQYCTESDVREILDIFDIFFRDEISKRDHLNNLYVLSASFISLEKLKLMNDILIKDDKKLNEIQDEVSSIHKKLIDAQEICVRILNSIAFILIAMAVFLGIGIFSFHTYDRMMLLIAPLCYGISEFLVFSLGKEGYVFVSIYEAIVKKYYLKIGESLWKIIATFIIPIILTVSCFWIINYAIDVKNEDLLIPTFGIICGNIVSILLKDAKFK